MPDRVLYNLVVPEESQTRQNDTISRSVSKQGTVGDGRPSAESVSVSPTDRTLRGWYRGKYSSMLARQFEELFDATGIEEVPYWTIDGTSNDDGYYSLENVNIQRADPRTDKVHQFDGRLTQVGTRRSHWRAIQTAVDTVTNDFGNTTEQEIAVHERSSKVRWFDRTGGGTESATVQRRVAGEGGTVEIYDTSEPTFGDPTLIYEIPHRFEGRTNCRIWDSNGRSEFEYLNNTEPPKVGTATVGPDTHVGGVGVKSWARVFTTNHDFRGHAVIDNGILRLEFYEQQGHIRATRWDSNINDWATVSLGSTDWHLFDVDLTHVGLSRVEAQVTFSDSTGSQYTLDMALSRGAESALWIRPVNESSGVPAGLESRLDPIAKTTDKDTGEKMTLVRREDTRK